MRLFTPSLAPTFRRQSRELYEAEDFAPITGSPELTKLVDALDKVPDTPGYPLNKWWFGSLGAIRDLLIRRAVWHTVGALCALLSVAAMQRIVLEQNQWGRILLFTGVIALCELAKNLIGYFDRLRGANIMRGVQSYLMGLVNRKLLYLDPAGDQEFSRGNLKTLVSSDVEAIEDFISAASHTWIPTFAMLIVLSPIILINLGWLGAIGIGTAILQIPLTIILSRFIANLKSKTQDEKDKVTTVLGEWVKNIRLVRFLGLQPRFNSEISRIMNRYCGRAAIMHTVDCIMYGMSHNWWMFGLASILIGGELLHIPIELGSFLPSCWALLAMMAHFNHIPYSISMYAQASASAKRVRKLFECPELTRHLDPAPLEIKNMLGVPVRIHIRAITFSYGERKIFDSFSLQLDLRKRTAILGAVGSGKSTLLELLCGELHPESGDIDIEFSSGVTAPLWSETCYREFRRQIAYSPQMPYLSNAKLHQNISLAETPENQELTRAVSSAQLEPDIEILRHGLEEEVGETGINLSGGQKQRVSMARAFYSKRPVFLLDDPLSAVDRQTELKLMSDILKSASGLVLVSHRIEELHHCDRIIVLENGLICEDATPGTLLADSNSRLNAYLSAISTREEEGVANE